MWLVPEHTSVTFSTPRPVGAHTVHCPGVQAFWVEAEASAEHLASLLSALPNPYNEVGFTCTAHAMPVKHVNTKATTTAR